MKKRIFSFFLALVMVFSCLSLNVFATEETTPATDSVTGDSLPPHTDEQIESFIQAITAVKNADGSVYSYHNGSKVPSINPGERIRVVDGRLVYGKYTTAGKDDFLALTEHSNGTNGRDMIKNFENNPVKGKSFVVQAEFELANDIYTYTGEKPLIRLGTYMNPTKGYQNNDYRISTLDADYVRLKITEGGVTLTAYNGSSTTYVEVMELEVGKKYTIAIHVDPQDVDESNKIYGSYDLYVNGVCVKERLKFLSSTNNKTITISETHPFFLNAAFTSNVYEGGEQIAHFFTDNDIDEYTYTYERDADGKIVSQTVTAGPDGKLDFAQVDDDLNGIPNVYDVLKDAEGNVVRGALKDGLTEEDVANITVKTIGKTRGAQDFCLSYARFLSGSAANFTGDAIYLDNAMVYYTESGDSEYVDVVTGHDLAGTSFIDPIKDCVVKDYVCSVCGGRTNASSEPLLFDVDLDEKLTAEELERFAGEGNVLYADPTTTIEGSDQKITVTNSGEEASYVVSFDLKFTDITQTGRMLLISGSPFLNHKSNTLYHFTGSSSTSGGQLFKTANGTTYNIALHHTTDNTVYVYVDGELLKSYEFYEEEPNLSPTSFTFRTSGGWKFSNIQIYRSEKIHPCAFDGHSYEVLHAHDYESGTVTVGYKCTKCDKTYLDKAAENGNCAICGGVAISDDVVITGRNATLGELIDMNIYADVSDELAKTEGATATITCGDKTETVALKDAEKTENGYKFSLPLRSTQMADDVTLTIDGATYTTSIVNYATELIATNEEAAPVAKALLNYGAAAQTYFAVKNGDEALDDVLANAGLSDEDKAVEALDAETLSKYAFTQSGDTDEARFTGAKLQLASKTHMKLYFKASAGATVTVNKETVPVHYDSTEKEYYVFLSDITPTLAVTDGAYTVVVTSGETEFRTTLSAMTAVLAGAQDDDQMLSNLMNAYGQYCLKATLYRANNSEV